MPADPNPYRPPESNVVVPQALKDVELAGRGRRFGTVVVDYAGFFALSLAIGIAVALVFGESALVVLEQTPDIALGVAIILLYYCFFEGIWARTPGKWLFGTVVVDEDGNPPAFSKILGRTLCRMIPFEPFSFIRPPGWHDSMTKTRVVLARRRG
jgi:uncharacterized RDD family membrane protein YckC